MSARPASARRMRIVGPVATDDEVRQLMSVLRSALAAETAGRAARAAARGPA